VDFRTFLVFVLAVICCVCYFTHHPASLSFGVISDKAYYDVEMEQSRSLRRLDSSSPANPHQLPTRHGHHFNHSAGHKRPWVHFQEVDGLRNEEVAVFVMSSTANEGTMLRERYVSHIGGGCIVSVLKFSRTVRAILGSWLDPGRG
jgi:hypothetical protein